MSKPDDPAPFSDEDYRFIASHHLDRLSRDRHAARQSLWDQSRWLVGQLFLVNAGGLIALLAVDRLEGRSPDAGPWFSAGLVFALVSALASWVQARVVFGRLSEMADPEMVVDPGKWPRESKFHLALGNVSFWIGALAALASLLAFIVGVTEVDAFGAGAATPTETALDILSS